MVNLCVDATDPKKPGVDEFLAAHFVSVGAT